MLSSGDEVFEEMTTTPSMLSGVFHWPTFQLSWPFVNLSSIVTPEVNPWQKQEVLKGVDLTAGTMTAGWGFHCWPESTPETTEWLTYSADDAALMVENGSIVTNSVFARNVPAMFNPQMSLDERHYILAFAIPAVSTATGKRAIVSYEMGNFNLNGVDYRNGWGRPTSEGVQPWLHSDMKDMAYLFINLLYNDIITNGGLR